MENFKFLCRAMERKEASQKPSVQILVGNELQGLLAGETEYHAAGNYTAIWQRKYSSPQARAVAVTQAEATTATTTAAELPAHSRTCSTAACESNGQEGGGGGAGPAVGDRASARGPPAGNSAAAHYRCRLSSSLCCMLVRVLRVPGLAIKRLAGSPIEGLHSAPALYW